MPPSSSSSPSPSSTNGYSSPSSSPQMPSSHTHRPPSLTVQTHNLQHPSSTLDPSQHQQCHYQQPPLSPASSINSYNAAVNTPLPPSPSPSTFFSATEEDPAMYSNPHSPHTPFLLDPSDFNQRLTDPVFQAAIQF
jgi:hypothetical protein